MANPKHLRFKDSNQSPPEAPAEEAPVPESKGPGIGELLRRERLRQGQDLADIAAILRIRFVHLRAIEEGRFSDLPGSPYAIGFVRAYADYLGLDADAVLERFRDEASELADKTELNFPAPLPEGRIPSGAILAVSVILAASAYGGWYYLSGQGRVGPELVSQLPDRLARMLSPEPMEAPAIPEAADPYGAEPSSAPPGAGGTLPSATGEASRMAGTEEPEPKPQPMEPRRAPIETGPPAERLAPETAIPAPPEVETARTESAAAPEPTSTGRAAPSEGTVPAAPEEPATPADRSPAPEKKAKKEAETSTPSAVAPPPPRPRESETAEVAGPEASRTGESAVAGSPAAERTGSAGEPASPSAGDTRDVAALPSRAEEETPGSSAETVLPIPKPPAEDTGSSAQVYGQANVGAHIVIRARQDSWVQVRDDADNLVLTRILRAGDVYRVPDRRGLTLLTGNAGALEILVDGKPAPPIGPTGAVRRNVALDAELLLSGNAVQD